VALSPIHPPLHQSNPRRSWPRKASLHHPRFGGLGNQPLSNTASKRQSRATIIINSAARVEPEIPVNAPRCRSCSLIICGKRTLSSTRTSTADPLPAVELWPTVSTRSTAWSRAAASASREGARSVAAMLSRLPLPRRRKLIPCWEHRTLRVPKVHPISLAISTALQP
jgi:hypothetical protein